MSEARISSTSERRQETINRLFAAARDQFALHGVASTGVLSIVQAAGFSRGAFYSNFHDLDQFILSFIDYEYGIIRAQLKEAESKVAYELAMMAPADEVSGAMRADALSTAAPNVDPLRQKIMQALQQTLLFDREFVLVFTDLALYAARHNDVSKALIEQHRLLIQQVAELVKICFDSFGIRLRVPAEECSRLLVSLFNSEYLRGMLEQGASSDQPISLSPQFLNSSLPYLLGAMVEQ